MAKEDRKESILQAAGRVFYVKGFEGTKMEDIAREAGIGKGTVYEYFASKLELFNETVAYHRDKYLDNIQKSMSGGRTLREKFIALAKAQTETVKEHINIFRMMSCSSVMAREMGALILEQNTRMTDYLIELVREAMLKGELRPGLDPEMAASLMLGTVNQYCSKKVVFSGAGSETIDFDLLADIVFEGLGKIKG